jgi:hypothetical protein
VHALVSCNISSIDYVLLYLNLLAGIVYLITKTMEKINLIISPNAIVQVLCEVLSHIALYYSHEYGKYFGSFCYNYKD